VSGVRLDKWLWAARFFKTRARAKVAIDGGKVHINGARGKPGKDVTVGDQIRVRQGWDDKQIVVTALSEQRRGAPEAQLLYQETADSQEKRQLAAAQRKAAGATIQTESRPTKKTRRLIHQFRDRNLQ
jgi:ribosome-associated heat shock protein Hsp15